MTRICLTILASILCLNTVAKNDSKNTKPAKYKAGVGLQYTYPHAALSLKIGITQHSVVQLIAAPYSFAPRQFSELTQESLRLLFSGSIKVVLRKLSGRIEPSGSGYSQESLRIPTGIFEGTLFKCEVSISLCLTP